MNVRSEQFLSWLCFALSGCMLAVAGYWYSFHSSVTLAGLIVAQVELEVNDCVPGQNREVIFELENRSGKPMRVYGIATC
jgi:uncharacterized protein (DUF58 family)